MILVLALASTGMEIFNVKYFSDSTRGGVVLTSASMNEMNADGAGSLPLIAVRTLFNNFAVG